MPRMTALTSSVRARSYNPRGFMPLTPGTRLGSYAVQSLIGAGGMGEVYRARDTKLNRDVAIKVLPDVFANDPDRLARFAREAQLSPRTSCTFLREFSSFRRQGAADGQRP